MIKAQNCPQKIEYSTQQIIAPSIYALAVPGLRGGCRRDTYLFKCRFSYCLKNGGGLFVLLAELVFHCFQCPFNTHHPIFPAGRLLPAVGFQGRFVRRLSAPAVPASAPVVPASALAAPVLL